MSIKSVMPSNHLILCHPFLLLLSIFPNIRIFYNESVLHISWPKYWRFSFQWIFRWISVSDHTIVIIWVVRIFFVQFFCVFLPLLNIFWITNLEPDILECEVKWALASITTNKASRSDGISVELFQILKNDAVKVLHSISQQMWKTQQWPQDWKSQFSFQFQR